MSFEQQPTEHQGQATQEVPAPPATPSGWADLDSALSARPVPSVVANLVAAETLVPPPGVAPQAPTRTRDPEAFRTPKSQARAEGTASPGPLRTEPPRREGTAPWPVVPGYEILGVLGRGGMGVVYKASQVELKRLVALKVIKAGVHADPEDLSRFRIEAQAVAQLRHPNIVQIYEIGEQEGFPYFSLEFVEGGSLAQQLDGTPLPARPAAELLEALARAMDAAHRQNLVHRDLKPDNVLLAADGQPKITDFGLAKRLDEADTHQTRSGALMGTPCYMSPEQAAGQVHAISPATDIYALGAILYELLTGRPPFKADSLYATLDQIRYQEPVPPRRFQPHVPRDLETLCLKCLEKEPRKRYPSAEALADDLRHFLNGEPIRARPISAGERAYKWVKRRPVTAGFLAACTVAVLSLVAGALVYGQLQHERASLVEKELAERDAFAVLRAEVQQLTLKGREAFTSGSWKEAQLLVTEALAKIGTDPQLAEERAQADRLRAEVDRRFAEQDARQQSRARSEQFKRCVDEVLFHSTQLTGLDRGASLEATRQAARQGLALVEMDIAPTTPQAGLSLDDAEKDNLRIGCYELLLSWADAEAQALTGDPENRAPARTALEILDRALGVLGRPTRAYHLQRARYLTQLKEDTVAAAERQRAADPELQPRAPVDHFLLGKLLMGEELGQRQALAQTIAHFESALQMQPDHFWAQFFIAVCQVRSRRPELAKASLTACASRRPEVVWTYILRGVVHGELREFEAADSDFRKALEQLPAGGEARGILLVNRGVLHFRQSKLEEATTDLQEALRLKPDDILARVNLAQVYQARRSYDTAIALLEEAVRLQPELAFLYRERAQLHRLRQDAEAALADLDKAVELGSRSGRSPDLAPVHWERGLLFYQGQKYEEAVRACEAALANAPDDPLALRLRAEALFQLAEGEVAPPAKRQRYQEAIRAFDRYLKHGKATLDIFRARAQAKARLGDQAGFIEDYTRALELRPEPSLYAARGWAYLATGASSLALRDFQRVIEIDPENGDAYSGRGFAQVKLGHYREAVADAEVALRKGSKDCRSLYKAARIFAQAMVAVDAEPRQGNARGPELRARCQDRALALIRAALEAAPAAERGPFWQDLVRTDPALNPLRQSSAFQQLAARYSQAERRAGTQP